MERDTKTLEKITEECSFAKMKKQSTRNAGDVIEGRKQSSDPELGIVRKGDSFMSSLDYSLLLPPW